MNIVQMRTEDLIPYERNQKKHDAKQVQNVANSIKRFGWQQPIVIDKKGVVVIGHCRLLAAKKLGLEEVPVTVAEDLTEDEVRELRIADNKTNESPWDVEFIKDDLQELDFEGFDFDFEIDDTEMNENAQVQREDISNSVGDVYQIVIEFENEQQMESAYTHFTEEGYVCRTLIL